MKPITIAIDGYAGCGKSTTAREVARILGYTYIDTGAMYRAVALYFLRNDISVVAPAPEIDAALRQILLEFRLDEEMKSPVLYMNDQPAEPQIRTPEVSALVSPVAALPQVRKAMVAQQRRIGAGGGVVMDGRDIGTYVFPNAELKVFMTADLETRARRRQAELEQRGQYRPLQEVMDNLKDRDHIDSHRDVAPLRQAEDAVVIDTSDITPQMQTDQVVDLARRAMEAPATS